MVTKKQEKELAKIARVTELNNSTFNFISHQGPPRMIDTIPKEKKTEGVPPRGYNFLTNLSEADHARAPTFYDEEFIIKRAGKPKEKRDVVGNGREFSIINNNFTHDHDRKKKEEYERFKSHTLEKYWATHDYDPVRGKYYDAEKEQRYRDQRQLLASVKGTAQMLKLAPSVQYSEGNCYDIVNHSIHDDGKVSVTNGVADRSLHRIKRVEKEKEAFERGSIKQEKDEEKRLARISYKRWENTIDRGFDFLKNSVTPADAPQPLPPRPTTMWARLQTQTVDSNSTMRTRDLSGAGATPTTGRSTAYNYNQHREDSLNSPSQAQRLTPLGQASRAVTSVPASRAVPALQQAPSAQFSARPQSQQPNAYSARNNASGNKIGFENKSKGPAVPSLDLTRAEAPERVSYVEPAVGAKGLAIPMVRTGGLSGF